MGTSLQAIIIYLLSDIAVLAATAIAYMEIRRATLRLSARTQQLAIGCLLGVAVLLCIALTP